MNFSQIGRNFLKQKGKRAIEEKGLANEIFSINFAFLFFCLFAIKLDFDLKPTSTHLKLGKLLKGVFHFS